MSASTYSIPTTIVSMASGVGGGDDGTLLPSPTANPSSAGNNNITPSQRGVRIALDDDERRLFEILVETVRAYESGLIQLPCGDEEGSNANNSAAPAIAIDNGTCGIEDVRSQQTSRLEVRVAGGWVRDKLLGLQTHDVDVAVNSMTGVQFASLVQAYIKNTGQQLCGRMGVIAANPDQSKHLETATMKVVGVEVDFCNLRTDETYEEHSRIPSQSSLKFGTPFEDAHRRDFTVNALFYNLITERVEDYTQRGIQDLVDGKLVTPLCPVTTFRDDPLRVLRAIRFAVRYNFDLDAQLRDAAMNHDIHRSLHVKVSRERVGKELEGMLSGKGANPIKALHTISDLKLAGSVFALPVEGRDNVSQVYGPVSSGRPHYYHGPDGSPEARHIRELGWEESVRYLDILPTVADGFKMAAADLMEGELGGASGNRKPTEPDSRLLPLAVYLLPFRELHYRIEKKPDKNFLAVSYVFRDGIKFKTKDVQAISLLFETVEQMATYLTEYHASSVEEQQQPPPPPPPQQYASSDQVSTSATARLGAGLVLRATKELWVTSLMLVTILKIRNAQLAQQQQEQQEATRNVNWLDVSTSAYRSIMSLGLDGIWKMRPLLDGKAVISALDLPRGPEVGTYLDEQVRWMLLNPSGTADQCRDHLMRVKRRRMDEDPMLDDADRSHRGFSDGLGASSSHHTATFGTGENGGNNNRHFSKKMHVESMDVLDD